MNTSYASADDARKIGTFQMQFGEICSFYEKMRIQIERGNSPGLRSREHVFLRASLDVRDRYMRALKARAKKNLGNLSTVLLKCASCYAEASRKAPNQLLKTCWYHALTNACLCPQLPALETTIRERRRRERKNFGASNAVW